MILKHFETAPLSTEVLGVAEEISCDQNTTIYVFWDSVKRRYSISDSKNIFAPIISGGYTPAIDAIYTNGHRLREPISDTTKRDFEIKAYQKFIKSSPIGLQIGEITKKFNGWWDTLSEEQRIDYLINKK